MLLLQRVQVRSLVGELRSHMLRDGAKKKKSQIFRHPKDAGQTGATSFRDAVGELPEA